ncbi:MAG TPA: 2-dehydropantoate 2-reductase N-terminal domain-containing protein, partial [Burkholderiales bacterium]|nr:2-dehydropantoate 2-reductase N-terminal domain-containing protein [Burkholderiales bacterium]
MKFAIFGAGGLGAFYGARLAAAGHEVGFVARGAQLEALRSKGLQVFSPLGDLRLDKPRAASEPAELGIADAVLVGVKTWQLPEAARAMRPLVGQNTMVVPFL